MNSSPPVKVNVKKRFYVILGIIGLVFVWLLWNFIVPSSDNKTDKTLTEPAKTLPYHYPFRNDAEKNKFIKKANTTPISSNDSLNSKFSQNKGIPTTFTAFILPKDSDQAGIGFTKDNFVYLPAVFLPPNDPNAVSAVENSNGTDVNPVLLAFANNSRNVPPTPGTFVRVYGILYWLDQYARGDIPVTDDQQGLVGNNPVFLVGAYENYSATEAQFPASVTRNLNITIKRGAARASYTLTIRGVEFNSSQTRIWAAVRNNANFAQAAWTGPSETTLDNGGGGNITCGDNNTDSSDNGTANTNEDLLNGDTEMNAGQLLQGYIICGPTSPAQDLSIHFPDLPRGSQATTNSFVVKIPAKQN